MPHTAAVVPHHHSGAQWVGAAVCTFIRYIAYNNSAVYQINILVEEKIIFIDAEDGSVEVRFTPVGKSWFLCEKNWGTSPSLILPESFVIFTSNK